MGEFCKFLEQNACHIRVTARFKGQGNSVALIWRGHARRLMSSLDSSTNRPPLRNSLVTV
jgi:hypothetical protein